MVACEAHYITLQSPVIRILSDGKRGCRFSFSAILSAMTTGLQQLGSPVTRILSMFS